MRELTDGEEAKHEDEIKTMIQKLKDETQEEEQLIITEFLERQSF